MSKQIMCIYNWKGLLTPYVAGYAYFIVDQLQSHNELKEYLDYHGGRWLLYDLVATNPVLYSIQQTIKHLTINDKMQLAHFVETHKSNLIQPHDKSVHIPDFLQVKMV